MESKTCSKSPTRLCIHHTNTPGVYPMYNLTQNTSSQSNFDARSNALSSAPIQTLWLEIGAQFESWIVPSGKLT